MIRRLLLFLVLNFGALALGGLFTSSGVSSEWYANLDKAPWTPPGWVFGFAWSTIMLCYTVYMAVLWPRVNDRKQLATLFALQWLLNVSWNPVFFYFHQAVAGLAIITLLTLLVVFFLFRYRPELGWWTLLLLPYALWLLIATSLNAYIVFNN